MTTYSHFAAIGSDMMAVYGVGATADEAIAEARREAGDPEASFVAVPMTRAAAEYVTANGGAPSKELEISRLAGVSLRSEP